jgi:hypothetical protein
MREFGGFYVTLGEDVEMGLRVSPSNVNHDGDFPIVTATTNNKFKEWIGITLKGGKTGDTIPVMPPYSGLVMAKIKCTTTRGVKTGWWANTDVDGYFTCAEGTGEISTGVIVTPDLDEAPEAGKIVKAMIFTGRFVYDQKG